MEIPDHLGRALSDRYRIVRPLGEGGMALVYLAEDLKHGRRVALKVLRPEISTAVGTQRFLREIEVVARLNHPNVLSLHDSGEADGLLYFVMPWVEGESLRARLQREGPLPMEEAVRIVSEVADALDYAHAQGLVHRDVKPENILFQAGHALVSDFGIARVASEADERLTRTGASIGTLAYMSPEQLGADENVDGRTDVYALGCVLFEMLVGAHPFAGGTPQTMFARKLDGTIPELSEVRPEVPLTFQPLLRRALGARPEDRPATAGAFATSIRDASTTVAVEIERRRRRMRSTLRRAGAFGAVVALAGGVWSLTLALSGPEMQRIAVLPLLNEADTTLDYFVQGAYADLVLEMSRSLRVINANSASIVASRGLRMRDTALELGVDGMVTGSVRIDTALVAMELQLVDGGTEEILWTETFEAHPRDIVDLYHRVTLDVAERTGVRLAEEDLERLASAEPVDPQVYRLLLQAEFHWQKLSRDGIDTAEDYYREALARSDSLSAEAWYGLGLVWGLRAQMGLASGEDARARQEPAFARARALDPGLSQLRAQEALRLTWGDHAWEAAADAFTGALAADPTDSSTRQYYAQYLLYLGHDQEAIEQARRAAEADPFNSLVQGLYGQFLNFVGRYAEADSVFTAILAREPESPHALSNYRTTYHLQGRYDEALEVWRRYYAQRGDTAALAALEDGFAAGGYRAALARVAETYRLRDDPALYWQVATLLVRAGNDAQALDYLERAWSVRDPNLPYITVDPIFDPIRDEPRLLALVDSLGLPR